MNGIALLLGLFVVPVVLLTVGHDFRRNSARQKSIFWGGTIGWLTAVVAVTVILIGEPVVWSGSGPRTWFVFWGLLAGGAVGVVLGALRPGKGSEEP